MKFGVLLIISVLSSCATQSEFGKIASELRGKTALLVTYSVDREDCQVHLQSLDMPGQVIVQLPRSRESAWMTLTPGRYAFSGLQCGSLKFRGKLAPLRITQDKLQYLGHFHASLRNKQSGEWVMGLAPRNERPSRLKNELESLEEKNLRIYSPYSGKILRSEWIAGANGSWSRTLQTGFEKSSGQSALRSDPYSLGVDICIDHEMESNPVAFGVLKLQVLYGRTLRIQQQLPVRDTFTPELSKCLEIVLRKASHPKSLERLIVEVIAN